MPQSKKKSKANKSKSEGHSAQQQRHSSKTQEQQPSGTQQQQQAYDTQQHGRKHQKASKQQGKQSYDVQPRPSGSEQSLSSGSGEPQLSGSAWPQLSGSVWSRPSGSGQPQPSGSGQPQPSGSGQPQPSGLAWLQPSGSVWSRSSGSGQPQPSGSGQPQPSGSGQPQPSGSGQPQPSGSERSRPSDSERSRQSDSERSRQSDSERSRQSDSERSRQSDSERSRQSDSERSRPSDSERSRQSDSERSRPSDSERSRPSDSGRSRPSDSERSQPSGSTRSRSSGSSHSRSSGSSHPQPSTSSAWPQQAMVQRSSTQLSRPIQQMYLEQIPQKIKGGKDGRKIIVETNMFKLIFPRSFETNVVHYDVIITPDKPKCLLRTVFEKFRIKQCPKRNPAFDGRKNAYSANNLPFGEQSKEEVVTIFDPEFQKDRTFRIYLKKVAVLDLSWIQNLKYDGFETDIKQQCIQALDIILRHGSAFRYLPIGRSIFQPPEPGRVVSLTNGLNLWIGVFQSTIIGSKAYLNVDVTHKGFPKEQSVIDLMKELCMNPRTGTMPQDLTPSDIRYNSEKITKFLKGLKIQYELQGQPSSKRVYVVNGLVPCPRENNFSLKDGNSCTVEQYFLQVKRYKIKYPHLPCLWVGSKNSKIYLPAELCTVVAGQISRKKMDDVQTSKMIRETATSSQRRKEKIMTGFAKMDLNHQPTLLNEFHFSVHGEFEKVPARVLEAPKLQYNDKQVDVFKGTWRADKFLKPCDLPENSWTILNLDGYVRDSDLHNLHERLRHGGSSLSMNIHRALTPFANLKLQRNITNIIDYFEQKKKQNIQLVLVILPNMENAYSVVKQISELKILGGIITQCIKQQTMRRLNDSTIGNILLKINSKLNGVNHTFVRSYRPSCLKEPCMIVGADVTHPSPDAINTPSIAAVAASHDPNAFQYNVEIRLQSPREEMIQDMEEIMIIQLKYFYAKTGYKPRRLIFYRDGVSDGQLAQVMHYELEAIKRAINRLNKNEDRDIAITFFVVQKRHHVRIFPTDRRDSDDKNFNVQAGTIVDSDITHPTHIDFYLVSHASIQGTARPTKYRCICNENNMHEDEIEQLTYYLCHMFARCTRSVSYPAPTYYAHLAAFRARALIHNVPLNIDNLGEEQRRKMTLQLNKNSPMFFV